MTDKNRLRVRNWTKFQHFKDRRPPWIKLYRDVLEDRAWHSLDPSAAKVLIGLWLLASEDHDQGGNLPDIDTISFRLRIPESEVIQALKHLSGPFIEAHDINAISTRYQDDPPETETETETEKIFVPSANAKPRSQPRSPTNAKTDYPATFERTWTEYPKRAGNNPKRRALTAWRARTKAGADPADIQAGVERYARYIDATGKTGTEFVMMTATFFGPDEHYAEPWTPPAPRPGANGEAKALTIGQLWAWSKNGEAKRIMALAQDLSVSTYGKNNETLFRDIIAADTKRASAGNNGEWLFGGNDERQ